MSDILTIWECEIKPYAQECIQEPRFIFLLSKDPNYDLTPEEGNYILQINKDYHSLCSMYFISDMIKKIEINKHRPEIIKIAVKHIYNFLNSPEYFHKIFKDEIKCDEYIRLLALRQSIEKSKILN